MGDEQPSPRPSPHTFPHTCRSSVLQQDETRLKYGSSLGFTIAWWMTLPLLPEAAAGASPEAPPPLLLWLALACNRLRTRRKYSTDALCWKLMPSHSTMSAP